MATSFPSADIPPNNFPPRAASPHNAATPTPVISNGASRLFLPASLLRALLHPACFCGMNRSARAEKPPPHRSRFLRAMKSLFLFLFRAPSLGADGGCRLHGLLGWREHDQSDTNDSK